MAPIKSFLGIFFFGCFAVTSTTLCAQGFTEFFMYNPGDLSVSSGGVWTSIGNGGDEVQVTNCRSHQTSPGGMDAIRTLGDVSKNDVWYYAVEFFVSGVEGKPLNDEYFIHFSDSAVSQSLACLKIESPQESDKDFGVSILASASSLSQTAWKGDFTFGDRVVAVVKWDNTAGEATLWVNPLLGKNPELENESVVHLDPQQSMAAIESLVLRQSVGDPSSGAIITINRLVAGVDFGVLVPIALDFLIQFGDINRDCMVNLLDVAPFVDLLINGQYDPVADFNFDGVVDLLDVELFIEALVS